MSVTASLLRWELLQQVDSSPIPRLWRRLTDSCSFSSYSERSQEALPKAARYWRAGGGRRHHIWWQVDTAQECHMTPTRLPAPRRLSTPHSAGKKEKKKKITAEERQKDAHPSQGISHCTWVSGSADPAPSRHDASLLQP